jgi:hypothetical protein
VWQAVVAVGGHAFMTIAEMGKVFKVCGAENITTWRLMDERLVICRSLVASGDGIFVGGKLLP